METLNKSSLAILFLVILTPMFQHSCLGQYTPSPSPLTQEQQDFLNAHNTARATVGVGDMTWDADVAAFAQSYATERSIDCSLIHSGNQTYGENIAEGFETPSLSVVDAVNLWVNESLSYHYDSNTCDYGKECGHYTQVVWRNSIRLGCARVKCNNGGVFVTCNYSPPGNYIGERPY
ncbi:hypothetical protein CASFOL_042470 [Castilleja foliolosa]|uniref:SCP domain-containing protein n=1 Tax=Castilleja foliolosa TaxID=1961234 RepID=A0ABD3BBB7_9LAMI